MYQCKYRIICVYFFQELPTNLSHVNVGENLSESSSICISNEKVNKNKPNKSTGKLRSTKSSKTLGCRNTVFIGPSLPPEPKPEELAQQQVLSLVHIYLDYHLIITK